MSYLPSPINQGGRRSSEKKIGRGCSRAHDMEAVLPGALAVLLVTRSQVESIAAIGDVRLLAALKGALVKVRNTPGGPVAVAAIEEAAVDTATHGGRLILSLARPDGKAPVKVPVTRLMGEAMTHE